MDGTIIPVSFIQGTAIQNSTLNELLKYPFNNNDYEGWVKYAIDSLNFNLSDIINYIEIDIINDINQMSDSKISQNIFKDYYNINQMRTRIMLINFYDLYKDNLESVKLNLKNKILSEISLFISFLTRYCWFELVNIFYEELEGIGNNTGGDAYSIIIADLRELAMEKFYKIEPAIDMISENFYYLASEYIKNNHLEDI